MSENTGHKAEQEKIISQKESAQNIKQDKIAIDALSPESKKILSNIFGVDINENSNRTAEIKQKALLFKSLINKINKVGSTSEAEITKIAKDTFDEAEKIYTKNLEDYADGIKLLESNWRTLQMFQERRVGDENKNLGNLTVINFDLNKLDKMEPTAIQSLFEEVKEIYLDKNTVVSKKEKVSYILLPAQNLTATTYKNYKDFYELILQEVNTQSKVADVKPKHHRFSNYNSNGCLVVTDLPGVERLPGEKQIDYLNRVRDFINTMDRAKEEYKFSVVYFNQVIFNQTDWNKADSWIKESVNKKLNLAGSAFALSYAVADNYDYFQTVIGVVNAETTLESPELRYPKSLHDQSRRGLEHLNISVLNKFDEKTYVESAKIGYYKDVEPGKEDLNISLSSANASMMVTKTLSHLQNETLKGNKDFNDQKFRYDLQRTLTDFLKRLKKQNILSQDAEPLCTNVDPPKRGEVVIGFEYEIGSKAEKIKFDIKKEAPELNVKV